jgi:hypothetical protein
MEAVMTGSGTKIMEWRLHGDPPTGNPPGMWDLVRHVMDPAAFIIDDHIGAQIHGEIWRQIDANPPRLP